VNKAQELLNKANEASFPSMPDLADHITRLFLGDTKVALKQLEKDFKDKDEVIPRPSDSKAYNELYARCFKIMTSAVNSTLNEIKKA